MDNELIYETIIFLIWSPKKFDPRRTLIHKIPSLVCEIDNNEEKKYFTIVEQGGRHSVFRWGLLSAMFDPLDLIQTVCSQIGPKKAKLVQEDRE